MNTATYLLNRLLTRILKNKNPFETWKGYKPSVQYLKVFGYVCYSHVPEEKRAKLNKKVEVGILMGYNNITKGYMIYQPLTDKLIVNKDVSFDESVDWN